MSRRAYMVIVSFSMIVKREEKMYPGHLRDQLMDVVPLRAVEEFSFKVIELPCGIGLDKEVECDVKGSEKV